MARPRTRHDSSANLGMYRSIRMGCGPYISQEVKDVMRFATARRFALLWPYFRCESPNSVLETTQHTIGSYVKLDWLVRRFSIRVCGAERAKANMQSIYPSVMLGYGLDAPVPPDDQFHPQSPRALKRGPNFDNLSYSGEILSRRFHWCLFDIVSPCGAHSSVGRMPGD